MHGARRPLPAQLREFSAARDVDGVPPADAGETGAGPVTRVDRRGSITLERVTQRFALPREGREFTAVQDVSFEVGGGEFVSIVGPSGCGKSTLLSLVAGLVPVTEGRISLDGQPVDGVQPAARLRLPARRHLSVEDRGPERRPPLLFRGVDADSARPRVAELDRADRPRPASRAIIRISSRAACASAWHWP